MNDIKNSLKVIYQYRMDYLKVTLLLTIAQAFAILPFIYYFFFFILRIAGVPGITDSNLGDIFSSPIAVIMLIVLVLLILLFVYYELGFFILMAIYQLRGEAYTVLKILQRLNSKQNISSVFKQFIFLCISFCCYQLRGFLCH